MKLEDLNVVVAGGATGGCAAALFLARAGACVTLLERVAQPRAIGAGIGLAENGMAVLEALGLAPAIEARARQVGSPRVVDGRGRTLLTPGEQAPRVWMVRRSDLQSALLDAVAAEPGVATRFGADVTAAHPEGRVTVRSATGIAELAADLVIGADGVHSQVRESGSFEARVGWRGIPYLRGLVTGVEPTGVEAWTAAGLFGSFAVEKGVYFYASAGSPAVREAVHGNDLEGVRAAWGRAYPAGAPILAAVERWDDLYVQRVIRVDCGRWHDGRLALVGDAAHAMAPNLGQGANSALVDAAVLVDELRRASDLTAGLAAYQARRQPAVRYVADTAARLGRLAERTDPISRLLRDRLLMPLLARFAGSGPQAAILQETRETLLAIGRA